tara:strand:- start:1228 stop:1617 length:390 start_codon:yes stop_codon:yes gene_type:complete
MERDEHGQLLTLEGMSSDDISDEIAAAETRMINLDTALALHETRAEAGAIPEDEVLERGMWAVQGEGSRRHQQGYISWLNRRLGVKNREAKEARARSHATIFVNVARNTLDDKTFDMIQDQVAERLERN